MTTEPSSPLAKHKLKYEEMPFKKSASKKSHNPIKEYIHYLLEVILS